MGDWPGCVTPGFRSPITVSPWLCRSPCCSADRRAGGRGPAAGRHRGPESGGRATKDAQNAKDAANNADTALSLAKAALAAANAHLVALNTQITRST